MAKVALVTGAGSAFGQKVSGKLLNEGFVVYGGVREVGELEDSKINLLKIDITNKGDCIKAIKKITKEKGRLDVLINLAGLTLSGPTLDFEIEDFKKILDINTVGPFRLIKYALPLLKKSKGNVVNITSLNGLLSLPNFGLYSASKHALEALGMALFYELKKDGIKVTNIAPGAIYNSNGALMKHKPAREKFKILYFLMPMVTSEDVSQKIVEVIGSDGPPASVLIGSDAKIALFLKKLLPRSLWTQLVQFVWSFGVSRKK